MMLKFNSAKAKMITRLGAYAVMLALGSGTVVRAEEAAPAADVTETGTPQTDPAPADTKTPADVNAPADAKVPADTAVQDPSAAPETPAVTDPVELFLSKSAFIGNSVGEGLTMYNNAYKKVPLGNATMLTRVCYSFLNDSNRSTKFLPRFNGTPMQAKDAVRECGAQYVFICMGTNDLVGSSGAEKAYERYQSYLTGIMTENPAVTIFIESCTPTRPGSNVSNEKVAAFNSYIKGYCDLFPNMFYVDIATPMMDETGHLSSSLSSDGSVHLTNKAYQIWADTVRQYIASFIAAQNAALMEQREKEAAVAKANYEKNIRKMDEKKQKLFEERMQAKRDAEAAEEERRRRDLLNVPDEVTLMQALIASESPDAPAVLGSKILLFAGDK